MDNIGRFWPLLKCFPYTCICILQNAMKEASVSIALVFVVNVNQVHRVIQ